MSSDLLTYYEKELTYLKQLGARFASEHPKVAGNLGIGQDAVEDPHVSRLIESVAFTNAQLQRRLDDGYSELSADLLECLYPHYLRPLPPFTVAQFKIDPELAESVFPMPRHSEFDTAWFSHSGQAGINAGDADADGAGFDSCRFRSTRECHLLPLEVSGAQLFNRPFNTPGAASVRAAKSVIKLSLAAARGDLNLNELESAPLDLFLPGNNASAHSLYRLLLSRCVSLVVKDPDADTYPIFISSDRIKPLGFEADEGLLPYGASSFRGYRYLTEFFAFPEKFSFVSFGDIAELFKDMTGSRCDLYIYLDESDLELEHQLSRDNFLLNCCPMVNLFSLRADPVKLSASNAEVPIQADARRPRSLEVYSVDNVEVSAGENRSEAFRPLYGRKSFDEGTAERFYLTRRRASRLGAGERDDGTDVSISLLGEDLTPAQLDGRTLHMELTCSNRDLVSKLPFNSEQPRLQARALNPPCQRIQCIVQPTRSTRMDLSGKTAWQLISHLALNHLSFTGQDQGAASFREILGLYNFRKTAISRSIIAAVSELSARRISAPLTIEGRIAVCHGTQIDVLLDPDRLSGTSAFLFAKALEEFFAVYASVNSFTRTVVRLKHRDAPLLEGGIRAGERQLL